MIGLCCHMGSRTVWEVAATPITTSISSSTHALPNLVRRPFSRVLNFVTRMAVKLHDLNICRGSLH